MDVVGDVVDFEHVCVLVWDLWGDVVVSFFLFGRKGEGGEGGKGADAGISASTGTFQILLFALIALKIKSNAPGYVLRGCG